MASDILKLKLALACKLYTMRRCAINFIMYQHTNWFLFFKALEAMLYSPVIYREQLVVYSWTRTGKSLFTQLAARVAEYHAPRNSSIVLETDTRDKNVYIYIRQDCSFKERVNQFCRRLHTHYGPQRNIFHRAHCLYRPTRMIFIRRHYHFLPWLGGKGGGGKKATNFRLWTSKTFWSPLLCPYKIKSIPPNKNIKIMLWLWVHGWSIL